MDKMNITTAQYIAEKGVNTGITAVIDGVTMIVPLDPANRHYQAVMGAVEFGDLVIEPTPTPSDEELAAKIRNERNALLTASDWTQVADAPVDQTAWAVYRQALRDIPTQEGFPQSVTWPTQPQ